ncbi:hypothetical protein [Pseudomonas phage Astolliot]|nr:hypothetical protein [Pseudomonas phage Astolliot]
MQIHVLFEQIEKLSGKHPSDWEESMDHFTKWHAAKGYPENDSEGKHFRSSQIWYAEYKADPMGNGLRPPYKNFWHWLLDEIKREIPENRTIVLDIDQLLEIVKRRNGLPNVELHDLTARAIAGIIQAAKQSDGKLTTEDVLHHSMEMTARYNTSIHLDWVIEILGHIKTITGSQYLDLEV